MRTTWTAAVYSLCEAPARHQRRSAGGGGGGPRAGVAAVGVESGPGAPADVCRAAAARTGALACALAAGPGLDAGVRRPGAGPCAAHHWRLAGGLSPARASRTAGRAARRCPPALNVAAQAAL